MLVGVTAVGAFILTVSVPVLAQVAVLTNIPLGPRFGDHYMDGE